MTELLYQTDSYLKEFEAKITDVDQDNHGVVLNRTAFYPGGGGQPADSGIIILGGNEYSVNRVKRIEGNYVHILVDEAPLPKIGEDVKASIDWDLRYQLMRTHTAMHVLCGVVFRDYGASVTGGNMNPLKGRMDFEFETMHHDLVQEIENSINQEVKNARDLQINILPREEAFQIPDLIRTKINLLPENIQDIRVVEIVGLDIQADGGTHLKNTSEVGKICVTDYKSKGKINKRIYVEIQDLLAYN